MTTEKPKTYITRAGDVWDLIAYRELGSCAYADLLIDANRDYADVAIFSAGVTLALPAVGGRAEAALPPWRRTS